MSTPQFRLLLALQVCPIDIGHGIVLAETLSEIEQLQGRQRADVGFVVVYRRDTNRHAVEDLVATLQVGFKHVYLFKSKGFAKGWPHGCNDLWYNGMTEISGRVRDGFFAAPAVLTFETDCVPLRADWIDRLVAEWEAARLRDPDVQVVGHVHRFPDRQDQTQMGPPNHINGNAIFSTSIFNHHKGRNLQGSSASQGWDAFHGKLLLEIGADTAMIAQKYRMKQVTRADIEALRKDGQIPALFHGIKESAAIPHLCAMIEDGSFLDRHLTRPLEHHGKIFSKSLDATAQIT